MTDTQSTHMGRGKNARRNKSTTSVGSKKNRTPSTSTIKFQPHVDGFTAFLGVVSKLGKHGQEEFTWHDLRKVYHRDTQRVLNVEELNAIFLAKNLTKREIFELPKVKRFLVSMDGSMMCRFRLIANPEDYKLEEIPPLMTASTDSDVVTQSSASPITSQEGSPPRSNEKSIAISTDCEGKVGPTSDLSKSEVSPSEISLTHQASVQSSMTDDEGWASGRDARSENSSPVAVDVIDGPSKVKCAELEDEVFEVEQRIAAGCDQIDGAVINDVLIVGQAISEDVLKPAAMSRSSPLLVTESVEAAFRAIQNQSFADSACTTILESTTVSEQAKVHATPRKVKTPVPAERLTLAEELSSGPPIKKLIEKFDTGVTFADHKPKPEGSPNKSIYTQVLEEVGDVKKQNADQLFVLPKREEHEETEITNVIFRSASTHSSIIAQEQEQLAKFTAEVEAKSRDNKHEQPQADTTTDETEAAFGVKEQSSMSSLDREYFDSKMVQNEDLFAELGVQDADGFQLKSGSKNSSAISAQKSASTESDPASFNLVTVIEKTSQGAPDQARPRTDSFESDADVPYSLCSEDEAEPMTMIEKSMKVSQSAEQLSSPKEEKQKTVVVNVELDAKAKRETVDVNSSVKERIAALQAVVLSKQVPIAKVDSIDEKDEVHVLNKSVELEQTVLEVKPTAQATNSDGSMRRRHVRFMRGCCVVQ